MFFGVNAHYLVSLALIRSKKLDGALSDDGVNGALGPYMIDQSLWDAGCVANDFEIVLRSEQIKGWRFQCIFAALNAYRSQCQFLDRTGRYPSPMELYAEHWPDGAPPSDSDWRAALDRTRDLVAKSLEDELEGKPADSATIDRPDSPIRIPVPDPTGPEIGDDEHVFVA